jgi:hypothetical protein
MILLNLIISDFGVASFGIPTDLVATIRKVTIQAFVCTLVCSVYWGDNFSPRTPCQWYVRGGGEGKRWILIGQSVPPHPFGMAFGRLKLSPLDYRCIPQISHNIDCVLGSLCYIRPCTIWIAWQRSSPMKGELRWRGQNSISKFDHHNIHGGAVDDTWRHR